MEGLDILLDNNMIGLYKIYVHEYKSIGQFLTKIKINTKCLYNGISKSF